MILIEQHAQIVKRLEVLLWEDRDDELRDLYYNEYFSVEGVSRWSLSEAFIKRRIKRQVEEAVKHTEEVKNRVKVKSQPIDFLDWENVGSMPADTYQKLPLGMKKQDLRDLGYGTDNEN